MFENTLVKEAGRAFACAVLATFLVLLVSVVPTKAPFAPRSAEAASQPSIAVTRVATGKLVMKKGAKYQLGAKASAGKLSYKSSKRKVVSVSSKGVLKALKPGTSTITVKAKSGTATASKKIKVTVVKAAKYKKVTKLKAAPAKASMEVGGTVKLKIAFTPSGSSNKNLLFTSSNATIAQVSASGIVTAKAAGNAKITVKSCDNAKAKASVTVSVAEASTPSSGDGEETGNMLDKFSWEELKAVAVDISACSSEAEAIVVAQERGLVGESGKLTGNEAKEITLADGTVCNVQLIGIWHDVKTGGGRAGLTFAFKEVIGKGKVYDVASTRVGWPDCYMRSYLNGEFFESLPQELSGQIVAVDKKANTTGTSASSSDSIIAVTSDMIWLLSMVELYGPFATASGGVPDYPETYDQEGSQYKYYADNGMTNLSYTLGKKYLPGTNTASVWWLRSPHAGNANFFFYVRKDGAFAYEETTYKQGIAPCFCL